MASVLVVLNWELKMGFPSFLLSFFLVFHLLLSSGSSCPFSFNCGHLGQIKFPFTNDTYPQCGLCKLSCSKPDPEVELGEGGTSYQVIRFADDTIKVRDPMLQSLIDKKSCDFSSYFHPLNIPRLRPSISFTISTNLTLFKCTNSPSLQDQIDKNFSPNYTRYRGCPNHTVYYSYPNKTVPPKGNYLGYCVPFQLPVVSSVENRNLSDPFSLLTSEFPVQYLVSKECRECLDEGGACPPHNQEFHCLKEKGVPSPSPPISPSSKVPKERGRSRLPLILGIVIPGVIILACFVLNILGRKKWRNYFSSHTIWKNTKAENYRNIEAFLRTCGSLSPIKYTYSDIKKITKSFRTKLGQGGFGTVFKGELENGSLVAVKVLKGSKGDGDEFINEVATISRTSHVNIVTLRGFCFEGSHRALIYDFMPNGSLDKFIHDGGSSTCRKLGWEALYRITIGIARGLEYLHRGCNTRILHFDIKPHNILLDEDFCPKISDFGLAKLCPQKESIISLLGARGTAGYIAPEVFSRIFGGVSHKSDVYSYGMMVLEIVGGRKNISVDVDHTSEIYFPHWVYKRLELDEDLGLHGIRDNEGNASARKMIIVGLWCIQTDHSHRPSMSRVVEMLEGSMESLSIPPKPFLSSPSRPSEDSSTTHVMK